MRGGCKHRLTTHSYSIRSHASNHGQRSSSLPCLISPTSFFPRSPEGGMARSEHHHPVPPPPPAAAAAATASTRRRRRQHGMRRACLVLVPLLVVVVVLLCLAGRVHAASSAPERQDGRGRQQQAEQQDRDMGGEPFGEGEEEEGHNDSSGTSGGDGAQGLPTFNLLHARSRAELEGEGYHCFPTGECIECTEEEMAQAYCKATQRREEVTCEREETVRSGVESQKKVRAVTTYQSCYATAGDDMTSMLRFQAVMAVLGGLALYGVRNQKLKHQTLYERRQMTRSRRRGGYSGV